MCACVRGEDRLWDDRMSERELMLLCYSSASMSYGSFRLVVIIIEAGNDGPGQSQPRGPSQSSAAAAATTGLLLHKYYVAAAVILHTNGRRRDSFE